MVTINEMCDMYVKANKELREQAKKDRDLLEDIVKAWKQSDVHSYINIGQNVYDMIERAEKHLNEKK